MKKIVFALFFMSSMCIAQNEITMNIGDFHTLKTFRGLQVELIKADTPKIIIDGSKASHVSVKNSNGVLKISMNISNTFAADEVMVYLYYSKEIDVIDANEGSHIYSDDVFKQEKMTVKAQEAGHIKLNIETDRVDVSSVTGGVVNLKGTSVDQKAKSNTGGIYKGGDLESETCDVSAHTGGISTVNVSKSADASASTGGMITVLGDPEEIKKSESLGGYVKQ